MQPSTTETLRFSKRIGQIPKSFIREILKTSSQPDVISFAGGLPNPKSFPIGELMHACETIFKEDGSNVLQYAASEGYLPLREWIAHRYRSKGLEVSPHEILITNGSQQGLDLIGKIIIDEGDSVLVEQPSYLGAIQAFSTYQPQFKSITLNTDGIDTEELKAAVSTFSPKLFYAIPNFQNPTGISYSEEIRCEVANIINSSTTLLVEDDPYGEIKFSEDIVSPIKAKVGSNGVLLGSFSKIISPGIRIGWVVASSEIIEKLLIAKQASDLHTSILSQRIIYQYLTTCNVTDHIDSIVNLYRKQKQHMITALQRYMPQGISYTNPQGGMFIWLTLPSHLSAYEILATAVDQKILFVPGEVFYTDKKVSNTLRLNFSNSNPEQIERGIATLAKVISERLSQ